jgi:hypothetical protein
MTGTAELSDDREYVERIGEAMLFGSGDEDPLDAFGQEILKQTGAKRVTMTITPSKVSSWDHQKLGGRY